MIEARLALNDMIHLAVFNVAYKLRLPALSAFVARRLA